MVSYKNNIKNKICLLQEDSNDSIENLNNLVRLEYIKALAEMKITGQSLQSVTYEFLEALEETVSSKTDTTLENIIHIMLDTLYSNAHENIQKSHLRTSLMEQEFCETIELEKAQLIELIETFQAYAEEKNSQTFNNDIYEKENLILEWFKNIQNKYYKHKKEVSMDDNCF